VGLAERASWELGACPSLVLPVSGAERKGGTLGGSLEFGMCSFYCVLGTSSALVKLLVLN
jgi:hypothetical protein